MILYISVQAYQEWTCLITTINDKINPVSNRPSSKKRLPWQQHRGIILCLIWRRLPLPRLNNTHPIFSEIFSILWLITVCDVIDFWTKTCISLQWEKIFQNRKHHSSSFFKIFKVSTRYFLLHRHFKTTLTLFASNRWTCNFPGIVCKSTYA